MHHQLFPSTPFISIFALFFISLFFLLPISFGQVDKKLFECFRPFDCGDLKNLTFPFWTEDSDPLCHQEGFKLTRCEDQPVIDINRTEFRLIYSDFPNYTMTIARNDLWENICLANPNVNLWYPFLHYSQTNRNLPFFYNCNLSAQPPRTVSFDCNQGYSFYAEDRDSYEQFSRYCGGATQVQVNQSFLFPNESTASLENWRWGFDVVYDFSQIFCSKCNSRKWKCENLSSHEYPICKRLGTHNLLNPNSSSGLYATPLFMS